MFLLALMMSSCPDRKPSGISKNMSKNQAFQTVSDNLKEKMESIRIVPEDTLDALKTKMKERGISFDTIVRKDDQDKRFIEIDHSNNWSFRILKNNSEEEKNTLPIAHYEISKYFKPLLGLEGGIDYLVFNNYSIYTRYATENLLDYKTGIKEYIGVDEYNEVTDWRLYEYPIFVRDLYYYKEGHRYIDALLEEVNRDYHYRIRHASLSPVEELAKYIEELEKTIRSLSIERKLIDVGFHSFSPLNDQTPELNRSTFSDDNYFNESTREIIRNIIREHESVFRDFLSTFSINVAVLEEKQKSNGNKPNTEYHNYIISTISKLLDLVEE